MSDKNFLKELLATPTPCGRENVMGVENNPFYKLLNSNRNLELFTNDNYGNIIFKTIGNEGKPKVMISGHMDEISLQVQTIDDKGFIHFIQNGGIDKKVLLGATVSIITKNNGIVNGVIGKKPIHVEWHEEGKDKATEIKDMKIDIGAESQEEAKKLVMVGDPIIIQDIPLDLGKNRFSGRGLDDKVGVYVTAMVLNEISKENLKNIQVFGCACTQEEVGGFGAASASKKIDPYISIDYDVTFATDDDYVSPSQEGDIKLGSGAAICISPDCNRELVDMAMEIGSGMNVQYFAKDSGGTNTVGIKQSSTNAQTLLISIPNRNMHTQVEVCDYRDLDSAVKLTVKMLREIDKKLNNN